MWLLAPYALAFVCSTPLHAGYCFQMPVTFLSLGFLFFKMDVILSELCSTRALPMKCL